MNLLGNALDWLIHIAANIAIFGLLVYILIQILIQFEIIPRHNQPARQVWAALHRLYDPLMKPIRQRLPIIGGFDLSPLVLMIGFQLARAGLTWLL